MFASLRALLDGIIDYAGLFPPAALPLDQALRNYARYRQAPESWMLARFICPVAQLPELTPFLDELFDERTPFYYSALGSGGKTADEFEAAFQQQWMAVALFQKEQGQRAIVDVFEIRLPPDFDPRPTRTIFSKRTNLTCFIEIVLGSDWRQTTEGIFHVIKDRPDSPSRAGFKLRCGGLHASAFPTPEQVAFTIAACRAARVPLKFTAGLHHPIRRFNAGVQTHMHGFINVFVAGVLAHARHLTAEQLLPIIEDEDASNFRFDDAGLHWKDHHATTDEIISARQRGVTSFGSCSFDEPRDDLRALGWLP